MGTYVWLQILRGNTSDACEVRDPCQHGGICISTDSGPICECRNSDYEGEFCEKGKKVYSPKYQITVYVGKTQTVI